MPSSFLKNISEHRHPKALADKHTDDNKREDERETQGGNTNYKCERHVSPSFQASDPRSQDTPPLRHDLCVDAYINKESVCVCVIVGVWWELEPM